MHNMLIRYFIHIWWLNKRVLDEMSVSSLTWTLRSICCRYFLCKYEHTLIIRFLCWLRMINDINYIMEVRHITLVIIFLFNSSVNFWDSLSICSCRWFCSKYYFYLYNFAQSTNHDECIDLSKELQSCWIN